MSKRSTLLVAVFGLMIAAETAEASRFLNSRFLNSRFLNSRFLNSADLNAATGGATFYNPHTGKHYPNVTLNRTTFVSKETFCVDGTTKCMTVTASGDDFVGTWTTGTLNDGTPTYTYIAGRYQPQGADPSTFLYWVYSWAQDKNGVWNWLPTCNDEHGNMEPAMPLLGEWNHTTGARISNGPNKFTWACTGGALGKCAASGQQNTIGYAPWKNSWYYEPAQTATGYWYWVGVDGKRTHQACTRMVRADYCGDGQSHTSNGNPIDLRDYLYAGMMDEMNGTNGYALWASEALWSDQGAVWMSCLRVGAIGGISCSNGRTIVSNSQQTNMCFQLGYLPTPEEVKQQNPSVSIGPGDVLLGTRTANLWAN